MRINIAPKGAGKLVADFDFADPMAVLVVPLRKKTTAATPATTQPIPKSQSKL
jgi:hypothetical protein